MSKGSGAATDSVFLAVTKLVTTLAGMVTTKILSTSLNLTEYGSYSQVMVMVTCITSLISFGLIDCVNYFYNGTALGETRREKQTAVNTIFAIELVLGAVVTAALLLGKNLVVAYFSNPELAALLIFAGIKPMLDNIVYYYQVLFVSIGRAKMIAVRNLLISVLKVIGVYIAAGIVHDLKLIMLVLVALDLIQVLLFQIIFAHKSFFILPFAGSIKMIAPILGYGIPMGIYSITNMLTRDIDKLIVGRLADTQTLAIYSNCSRVLPFDIFSASLATVLIPHIFRLLGSKNRKSAVQLFRRYLQVGYYSVWTLAGAVLLAADEVIPFLYSDEYLAGKAVFVVYVIDSMLRFASVHLVLTATGKTKQLMGYSMFALLVNGLLSVQMFYLLGILGPALATLVSATVYTGLVLRATASELGETVRSLFDLKDVACFVVTIAIAAVPLYGLRMFLLGLGWNRFFVMLLVAGLYVLISLALNGRRIWTVFRDLNALKSDSLQEQESG